MNKNKQAELFNKQVNDTYQKHQEAFMDEFLDPDVDPESDEFKEYSKRLSHKWKTYCHIKHLTRPAFIALDSFIEVVLTDYKGRKAGTIDIPADEPQPTEKEQEVGVDQNV